MNVSVDERIIVLGFYDRYNIGDEAYKLTIPSILNTKTQPKFQCIDDFNEDPNQYDIIIFGGGDIINSYFMEKAIQIIKDFKGRIYGLSVGIPFENDKKYLHMFDHLFVRSKWDYDIAASEVGERNVTLIQDAVTLLKPKINSSFIPKNPTTLSIGLTLAQPYFVNNPNQDKLLHSIIKTIIKFTQNNSQITTTLHLLPFNHNLNNSSECDYIINDKAYNLFKTLSPTLQVINHTTNLSNPQTLLDFINTSINIHISMRYHGVIFALLTNTPVIAIHTGNKIKKLLEYMSIPSITLPTDSVFKPTSINKNELYEALLNPPQTQNPINQTMPVETIRNIILRDKKLCNILIRSELKTLECVLATCKVNLIKYFDFEPNEYDALLITPGYFANNQPQQDPVNISRYICYIISGQTHHPCVWGLAENMLKPDFILLDAIKYIWNECKTKHDQLEREHYYYPTPALKRSAFINLDFVFQNDFAQYHRSGWSYVIGGLMNLDAPLLFRKSDTLLDTYVDRSFHWGLDILKNCGIVPYIKPWYGFIHHTFDTTHSDYNNNILFQNKYFLESLKTCKGLIALSKQLQSDLQRQLQTMNINIPVFHLYHPMEFTEASSFFNLSKFLENSTKNIVQIGAWLRDPYAIYELPITSPSYQKIALKGKEMDLYFQPPNFQDKLNAFLLETNWNPSCDHAASSICRPRKKQATNTKVQNKYCEGIYNMLQRQTSSVKILQKLNNDEYDALLTESIIFLNLKDASAVNTVIECIVRNTPLIVNRLPSLEEYLGTDYPGFYDNLREAAIMCESQNTITSIYVYMMRLNKERYQLAKFIEQFQNIIQNQQDMEEMSLLTKESFNIISKFPTLSRYLPRKFLS